MTTESLGQFSGVGGRLAQWREREAALRRQEPTRLEVRIKRFSVVGVVLLALLNAADAVTTKLLLQHVPAGSAHEANPLAGLFLGGQDLLMVKLAIVALLGMAVLRDRPRLGLLIGVSVVTGFYLTAVLSNLLILRMY